MKDPEAQPGEIVVYGASDDLIEIDGEIRGEFGHYSDDGEPAFLAFSDGTILSVLYDAVGFWRINRAVAGSATYSKTEGTDGDEDYSDVARLTDHSIKAVVFGSKIAHKKQP